MSFHLWGGGKSSHSKGLQGFNNIKPCHYEQIKGLICEVIQPFNYQNLKRTTKLKFTNFAKKLDCFVAKPFAPRNDMKRKAAFTLAEVLITLGIIGVVAALTLPTLISNYQKQVYVNQLKKSVSVFSNGFKLMMAHDGVTELKDTHAFSGMGADGCGSCSGRENNILTNNCSSIREGLTNVFSGIQLAPCDETAIKYLNGTIVLSNNVNNRKSTLTCAKFPDGSEIYGYQFNKLSDGLMGYFRLDINGPKNPNTIGRDIFLLYVSNNGTIVPNGSQQVSDYELAGNPEGYANAGITSMYWRTTQNASSKCTTDDSSARGTMCAARVLEEDAMNY